MDFTVPNKILEVTVPNKILEVTITSKLLGFGGFGEVYEAKFRGDTVAVKKEEKQGCLPSSTSIMELKILKLAEGHCKNIVQILYPYSFFDTDYTYIMMEVMDMSLHVWNDLFFPSGKKFMEEMMLSIGKALKFLHNSGFSHNDVKLGNILIKLDEDRQPYIFKLCDFGSSSEKGEKIGDRCTFAYRAPEYFCDRHLKKDYEKMDVWSLGMCCLYLIDNKISLSLNEEEYINSIFNISTNCDKYENLDYWLDSIEKNKNRGHLMVDDMIIPLLRLNNDDRISLHDLQLM